MTIVLPTFFFLFRFLFSSRYILYNTFTWTSHYVIEQCICFIVMFYLYRLYDSLYICLFLVLFSWLFLEDCLESFDFIPFLRCTFVFWLFFSFVLVIYFRQIVLYPGYDHRLPLLPLFERHER